MSRPGRWVSRLLRIGVSAAVLGILARTVDVSEISTRFREADPRWILVALALTVAQVTLSAWRWRYTARKLGLELPFREALREYYLATFLNQVLPGGVLGDVSRAWRQARRSRSKGSAARSVLLERASGQIVMLAGAGVCAAVLAVQSGFFLTASGSVDPGMASGLVVAGAALTGMVGAALRRSYRNRPTSRPFLGFTGVMGLPGRAGSRARARRVMEAGRALEGRPEPPLGRLLRRTGAEARRAFLHGGALPVQLGTSLLVVASYVLVFVLSCRAVGVDTPAATLALLIPPVLVAMLIPISLAGWGLREGAAAALWAVVGLPAAQGTAASVMYGLLVLASSLPGAVVLLGITLEGASRREDPGRTGRRIPGGRSDTEGGGPNPASRSGGG